MGLTGVRRARKLHHAATRLYADAFAGPSKPEVAQALGLSLATAERYWTYARLWLYAELSDTDHPE
jgi:hypothetical protein